MTEEEAKTKWCPHVRYSFNESAPSNRWNQSPLDGEPHALNPIACRCIGSACMAWRWRDGEDSPINAGYCGLAGKP